jgi:hypothetical protein
VVLLARWIEAHGRTPTARECCNNNGLPHYTTLYKRFGSPAVAVSAATTPGVVSAALAVWQITSQAPDTPPTRPCLRCGTPIPCEGAHVRQCTACRRRLFGEDEDEDESPHAAPSGILAWLMRDGDEEILDA